MERRAESREHTGVRALEHGGRLDEVAPADTAGDVRVDALYANARHAACAEGV